MFQGQKNSYVIAIMINDSGTANDVINIGGYQTGILDCEQKQFCIQLAKKLYLLVLLR